jgi:hypothetical protein
MPACIRDTCGGSLCRGEQCSPRICGGREGEGGRDHAHMTHSGIVGGYGKHRTSTRNGVRGFEGSRFEGSRFEGSNPGPHPEGIIGPWGLGGDTPPSNVVWFERGGAVREFCAGHACSPESSGRKLQGGGGHTFEGSLSSPLSSGSLGSVLLPPAAVPVFCWGGGRGFFVGVDTMRCPCISNA